MSEIADHIGVLRAAGEETRLRILALVRRIELAVSDLVAVLGQSQPRVSRHLKILTDAGLLERHREGAFVFYRPPARPADPAAAAIDAMLAAIAAGPDAVVARDYERLEQIRAGRAEAAAAYFEKNAADWDDLRRRHLPEADIETAMREVAAGLEARTFVDLGVGTGRMLELFADRYEEGVGYDLSRDMLAIARAKLEAAGIAHAHVRQGDILAAPYPSGEADIVCIHQVLHFLDEPSAAIAEAARILSEAGRIIIVDFAPHEIEDLRAHHAHRRLGFSDQEMRRWCAAAGLAIAETRTLGPERAGDGALVVKIWVARRAEAKVPAVARAASLPGATA